MQSTDTPSRHRGLTKLLDEARKHLIDTGTRNRLVHTNRRAKRPATLTIVQQDAADLFDRLVNKGAKLRFLPDPAATERERKRGLSDAEPDDLDIPAEMPPSRTALNGENLQTRLGENGLQKKLLKLAREAKVLEDEQGINILYLAIGFLRWYEDDKSDVPREAPLVLIPVSLDRDVRRSAFDLRAREDDLSTNLPLAERLRDQEGIVLPELPEGDDWSPDIYFDAVASAISGKSRWSVDRNGVELGFFSFAKLLMYHDLSPDPWPDDAILDHPLLRGLMVDGFGVEAPLFPNETQIDRLFHPQDLIHVVDADGSQSLVIETVRAGRNLVVQGPPGTGKSQTIANIIASAAHDGKRVLFIAEKMVALHVVYERLKRVGLGDLCLELHSRAANKRQLAAELSTTLAASAAIPDLVATTAELTEVRDKLNKASDDLHTPIGRTGLTAYQVLGELVRAQSLNLPPASTPIPDVSTWSIEDYVAAAAATQTLARAVGVAGLPGQHPWRGTRNISLQPMDIQRLEAQLAGLQGRLAGFDKLLADTAKLVGISLPETFQAVARLIAFVDLISAVPRIDVDILILLGGLSAPERARARTTIEAGADFTARMAEDGRLFLPASFSADVAPVRAHLARGTGSLFYRWSGRYRRAAAELRSWTTTPPPKAPDQLVRLADRLHALQEAKRRFDHLSGEARQLLGLHWQGEQTQFDVLSRGLAWTDKVRGNGFDFALTPAFELLRREGLAGTLKARLEADLSFVTKQLDEITQLLDLDAGPAFGTGSPDEAPRHAIAARLQDWLANLSRYEEWSDLSRARNALVVQGLESLANRISEGELAASHATEELRYARGEALWASARMLNPALAGHGGTQRNDLVARFQKLDRARNAQMAELIRAKHLDGLPRGSLGEMGVIRGEAAKKRGHLPIRKLMTRAGSTVQRIKPVFLMSPISVAQFLPPGSLDFDLLVIDEASQVRPEDALGVIARAKQFVVVGDVKQLPPTNFFSRLLSDDDESEDEDDMVEPSGLQGAAKVSEMESVLTLCEARGIAARMLRWHYRSRHPSLIEISNAEFYRNLVLPPSPVADHGTEGLLFRRVQGAYDRGGKRTNAIEARAVVDALAEHARRDPHLSIGIATFSSAQRDQIAALVDEARRTNAGLDTYIREQEANDDVFIKSIENVQGDERDVILISVGYGPRQPAGRMESMAFGPIATEGGERRLNVLFTRARQRCEVFASFDPGDIDLNRARSEGARILKRYLTYAATGVLDEPVITGEDYDSAFEADVAAAIRRCGYAVDAQVGSAGFRIDLAVRHPIQPGRHMLAVECDGAAYHGALWARERDRLRQSILEDKHWRFHRIWSTDWFYRREAEIQRLRAALEGAARGETSSMRAQPPAAPVVSPSPPNSTVRARPAPAAEPYVTAAFPVPTDIEPHLVPVKELGLIIGRVISLEGPIHEEELARRIAGLFQKEKAGSRIVDAVRKAAQFQSRATGDLLLEGPFWFNQGQKAAPRVRNRAMAPNSLQKGAMLPPIEIQAAIAAVFVENGALTADELSVGVARQFGFLRNGSEIRAAIDTQIAAMVSTGRIVSGGGMLRQA